MSEQARRSKTFDALPNEVLFEILKWLNMSELKHFPLRSERCRLLSPLTRVNHRLRAIALELLRGKVVCRNIEHLERVTDRLEYDWEADPSLLDEEELAKIRRASLVRYVSLDHGLWQLK